MSVKRQQQKLKRQKKLAKRLNPPQERIVAGLPPVSQFIPKSDIGQEYWDRQPSIHLDQCDFPLRLIIEQKQSPGDIVALTAALRDLHYYYPGWFLTDVDTSCDQIFEASPYITALKGDPRAIRITIDYPLIHRSNEGGHHFCHAFVKELNTLLGLNIELTQLKGDIHLSNDEKGWFSQIYEMVGKDIPYWIIDAGCKHDYLCKMWEFARFQDVVTLLPDITFVQIGQKDSDHHCTKCKKDFYDEDVREHPPVKNGSICPECSSSEHVIDKPVCHFHHGLIGDNVINLVGQTDLRQLIRLVYHSYGVISPVSLPMHLAAAVEMHPRYNRPTRPCVVIAGGREPSVWEMYTNHAYFHKCGMLDCCYSGGCWKSRVFEGQVGDGDEKDTKNLCEHPVTTESGQRIPKCLDMITVEDIVRAVKDYQTPTEVDQPKVDVKTKEGHILYKTGDEDAPEIIKDQNGEVVLGLCKLCGRGEAGLAEECDVKEVDAEVLQTNDQVIINHGPTIVVHDSIPEITQEFANQVAKECVEDIIIDKDIFDGGISQPSLSIVKDEPEVCSICHGTGMIRDPNDQTDNIPGREIDCPDCRSSAVESFTEFLGLPDEPEQENTDGVLEVNECDHDWISDGLDGGSAHCNKCGKNVTSGVIE